jgi:serine phosphatase RsbU (regulator of sigma subunit)
MDGDRQAERLVEELQRALAGSEARLAVILDSLAEAVTIRGRDDRLIYANSAALARLSLDSVEQLRAADPRALMTAYETTDEHGGEVRMDDLPSVKLLRGEQPEPLLLRAVDRKSGDEQWTLLKATAVRDADGEIEAAVTIIEDVTRSKRASLRMEFLAQVGDVLASSLDYQQTLRNVAGLAVPQIADWCAVDLFTEDGRREPVAIAHSDPAELRTAARLRSYEPEQLNSEQGLGLVLRTGESQLYTDIPDELLVAAALDDEHLRLLREVGMRAVLIVPLRVRERTIGALTMVDAESGRSFDRGDLEFAEQIAARAALAVEGARLYSERSAIARTLQDSLLPEAIPEIPGWEVAALYRPAGQEGEVGGDFYDFWELDGEWLMVIGDVTGKGVGAAAVTSLVRHTARAASEFDPRPAQVLARIDAALRRRPAVSLCTALCLRISPDGATLAVGGHPPPLCIGEGGVSEIGEHGTLLGALARTRWPETRVELRPGETLVAFTDGVTDTVGEGGVRWGTDRLKAALAEARGLSPSEIGARLVTALDEFQVGAQADDTAVVIMRYSGESPTGGRLDQLSSVGARGNG